MEQIIGLVPSAQCLVRRGGSVPGSNLKVVSSLISTINTNLLAQQTNHWFSA